MAAQLARKRNLDETPAIPDRLYFKIGDVARICAVETYVLRFWESQFPQLKPNKSGTGQRLYRRRDVEMALQIKRLVHAQGYTLAGARQALDQANRRSETERVELPKLEPRPVEAPPTIHVAAPIEAPLEPQSRLALQSANPNMRIDSVVAAIHHARAELRDMADLLASPVRMRPPRRPRISTLANASGTLFPS